MQAVPGQTGYTYYFNSLAEGPMMTTIALKQILVLLHIIHSFVPEECILETEFLKPTFNSKQGGLDKLVELTPIRPDEWMQSENQQREASALPICDLPLDIGFNSSCLPETSGFGAEGDSCIHRALMDGKTHFKKKPVDVAEILVAPVCVTYTSVAPGGDSEMAEDDGEEEKMLCFWLVILKTRKCYNFNEHLRWMVNELDKEDRMHSKKIANREYEGIMSMLREVVLHQYENSPDATLYIKEQVCDAFSQIDTLHVTHFQPTTIPVSSGLCNVFTADIVCWQGVGSRLDPFQRMTELESPDTLDSLCSVYSAYRSMIYQVTKSGNPCTLPAL